MNQISPLAFVHPDAKLGDNNIIGPFCYIDADVVIGGNDPLKYLTHNLIQTQYVNLPSPGQHSLLRLGG